MALLFFDGFDHYVSADILEKWSTVVTAAGPSAGGGRRGTAGLNFSTSSGNVTKVFVAPNNTIYFGAAMKVALLASTGIFTINDAVAAKNNVILSANADGSLSAYARGTSNTPGNTTGMTVLGTTAPGLIVTNAYNYIEVKVALHATAGEVIVKFNGVIVLNLTGLNTFATGSTGWTTFAISGAGGGASFYDDFYLCDGSGAAPWNTFLGEIRVDALVPTAAGATTQFTPSTGANWQNVDDAQANDDTDFNTATAAGLTDTFTIPNAPVVGAPIFGVQHHVTSRKTDGTTCTIAPVVRPVSTDFVGTDIAIGTTYVMRSTLLPTNPATGAQWTEAGFNAAEFGYKRVA